jgi:DNA-binding NarL/FixJ family response regulator
MEAVSEATAVAPEVAERLTDTGDAQPGGMNVVFSKDDRVREQFAELAKAVQGTMAAPAHAATQEACAVYGLCVFVPQHPSKNIASENDVSAVNVVLLAARPDDRRAIRLVEVEDGASAETWRMLRNLLAAMQKVLAVEADEYHPATGDRDWAPAQAASSDGALPHQKLSEREYQVVHMLSKGKTVGAISKELNLSVKTVSTYRVRALKKMNFKTNAELIRYMIQYKLG